MRDRGNLAAPSPERMMSLCPSSRRVVGALLFGATALLSACSASPDDAGLDPASGASDDAGADGGGEHVDAAPDQETGGDAKDGGGDADAASDAPSDAKQEDAGQPDAASDAPFESGAVGSADYPLETEPNGTEPLANALPAGAKGFAAGIGPNDVDYFSFSVPVAGSSVRIETSDGKGGCPAGAGTVLKLFSPANVQLGFDSDSGVANCSLIDPATNAWADDLPAGTYAVAVSNYPVTQTVSAYIVSIQVTPPSCGDHKVQTGEDCDDGAHVDGDGCSAGCTWEIPWQNEVEPNATRATANALQAGKAGFRGVATSYSDDDWYSFTVTKKGSSLRAQIVSDTGTCLDTFSGYLELWSPTGTYLGEDYGSDPACPTLAPPDTFVGNLDVGTYTLHVYDDSFNYPDPYALRIEVLDPGCGDGFVQAQDGEECDDGNRDANDGCSPSCTVESLGPNDGCPGLPLALSGSGAAPRIGLASGTTSTLGDNYGSVCGSTKSGKDAVYEVVPDVSGQLSVSLLAGFDAVVAARTSCNDTNAEVACSVRVLGSGTGGSFTMPVSANTPLWLFVDGNANTAQGGFSLTVTLNPAACGNYVIDPGEQCDLGSPATGSGCTDTCTFDPPYTNEIESNDSKSQATPLDPGAQGFWGAVGVRGDVDWFSFDVPGPSSKVTLQAFTAGDPASPLCPSGDTVLHLVNPAGVQLGSDDNGSKGLCSKIDPASYAWAKNLAAGTYYVWVEYKAGAGTIPHYGISVSVQ